jgi:hypothetical protein
LGHTYCLALSVTIVVDIDPGRSSMKILSQSSLRQPNICVDTMPRLASVDAGTTGRPTRRARVNAAATIRVRINAALGVE